MNIEYFFKDSKDNKSIKTLFEKAYELEDVHEKKEDNEDNSSIWALVIPMGMFFVFFGMLFTFVMSILNSWVKNIFENNYGVLALIYFFIPFTLVLIGEIIVKIEKTKIKKELEKKLELFYQEDIYIPILKQLAIFNDLTEKGNKFIINLNNKELQQTDISYIFKKYDSFLISYNKSEEINIIDNIKNKVLNQSNEKKSDEKKLKFFNQK